MATFSRGVQGNLVSSFGNNFFKFSMSFELKLRNIIVTLLFTGLTSNFVCEVSIGMKCQTENFRAMF